MANVKIVKNRIGLNIEIPRDKIINVDIPNGSIIFNFVGGIYLNIPDDVMPNETKEKISLFLSGQKQQDNVSVTIDLDNYRIPVRIEVV